MQTVPPASVGLSSSRLERVGRAMQKYVDQNLFAGMVVLIARQGQVAYLEKFGFQDIAAARPMAFDTIFRIYSMTKPITSAAVMMLVEEAKVRLSDPLSRYIPGFKNPRVLHTSNGIDFELVPARREPTVHDLFTHTAGFTYGFDEFHSLVDERYRKEFWALTQKEPGPSLEEMIAALARLPLAYHPGTAYRYSVAIDVLGYIVQVASGLPFDTFLKEKIFDPLGMVDTAFWVPSEKADRLAVVYGPQEGGRLKANEEPDVNRYTHPPSWLSGGGGLVSTISDYFRFGQMLLNQGALDGVRLLGRKTVEWMMQNHLPKGVSQDGGVDANGFGLGGYVLLQPGLSHRPGSVGKFGWGGAANTEWWIDPAEQLNCILMTQYMPPFTLPLVEDFTQTAYQALE